MAGKPFSEGVFGYIYYINYQRIEAMSMNLEQAKEKLNKYGQLHVLDHYDTLTDEQKEMLLKQIDETDFSVIRYAKNPHGNQKRGKIEPLGAMEISEIEKNEQHFREVGLAALRARKIGAVLLAVMILLRRLGL